MTSEFAFLQYNLNELNIFLLNELSILTIQLNYFKILNNIIVSKQADLQLYLIVGFKCIKLIFLYQ